MRKRYADLTNPTGRSESEKDIWLGEIYEKRKEKVKMREDWNAQSSGKGRMTHSRQRQKIGEEERHFGWTRKYCTVGVCVCLYAMHCMIC